MRGADARRDELSPSAFRIVGETQYCEIRRRDHPRVEQHVEIDHLRPIAAVDANQRDGWSLASLHQRQHLEQLGERAESAGEGDHRRRADRQMDLAHGEGVELKGELRSRIGIRLLLARHSILNPMDGAPTSNAPRLAASMMPGPPPVAITLSRWPPLGASAPPRSDTMRPKRRDSSYQCDMPAAPCAWPFGSRIRALPRTTIVVRTPHWRSRSSALANSSRKRTPCMESLRMKSASDAGRRYAGDSFCRSLSGTELPRFHRRIEYYSASLQNVCDSKAVVFRRVVNRNGAPSGD